MQSAFWKSGASLAVALTMAACSGSPASPTSPSAATGGNTTAAADGSTLKATAPTPISPVNGARVESLRPMLEWTASSGTFTNFTPSYEIEVTRDGAIAYSIIVEGTSHQVNAEAEFDQTYSWRVRARLDDALGPWSPAATFQSPLPTAGVTSGYRTPDPAPGTRLPLPNESGLVNDEYNRNRSDWQNSCQERQGERGWIWIDKLIDRLRTKDLRWGYNGKRGNPNDPSLDVIDYHYGAGDSQFSTQVYIIDVLFSHCGNSPSPAWIDQTAATAAGRSIGRFIYPRPGRTFTQ
ncbi:MAG: hypothetical protein R2712_29350 [Vicinamibacterales bacterium]